MACSGSECLDARAGIGHRATVSEPMTQALPRVPRGRQFIASIGRCRPRLQSCSSPDRFRGGRQQRSSLETSAKLPDPLSPPCGGRCHGVTEGGSSASNQIGREVGRPPSGPASSAGQAFGISPARGEKGSFSKVSCWANSAPLSKPTVRRLGPRRIVAPAAAAARLGTPTIGPSRAHWLHRFRAWPRLGYRTCEGMDAVSVSDRSKPYRSRPGVHG